MVIYGNSSEHFKVDVIEISKFTQEHDKIRMKMYFIKYAHVFVYVFKWNLVSCCSWFLLMGILVDGWVDKGINFENFFSNFLVNIFV